MEDLYLYARNMKESFRELSSTISTFNLKTYLIITEALESILHNILAEDRYLRPYRRTLNFGQHVQKDLIPLLLNAKEDETVELIIRILVNLTTPVECLLSVEIISQSDFGRHTLYELNNLLATTKKSFMDDRATKVLMDYFKKNADFKQQSKITLGQCTNISNCLLLFRNLLHIPEDANSSSPANNGSVHVVQNQILWNIFSQSFDKVLIKLMTLPEAVSDKPINFPTIYQLTDLCYQLNHIVRFIFYLILFIVVQNSKQPYFVIGFLYINSYFS